MRTASKSINIGTISATTNVNIGSAGSTITLAGTSTHSGLLTANGGINTTTLDGSGMISANGGVSSTTYLTAGSVAPYVYYLRTNGTLVQSLTCGNLGSNDGVLSLESATSSGGSILQTKNGNTYLDSSMTLSNAPQSINIGTITPYQNINIGSASSGTNINGTMLVNGVGGTTVATQVKFKSYGKISNWVLTGGGTPTLPIVSSKVVPITGFTTSDVPYLYCYASSYNSGTYNCPVIANVGSLGTSISFYANNLNASTTCQVYWSLKYIV